MLYFQPAIVTPLGVCPPRPVMWIQASACASHLPPDHTVKNALYVSAYDFPFMQRCTFLLPLVLLITFHILLYFSTSVLKVFTLQKSANTVSPPPSCRKMAIKHLPACQHLPDWTELTQALAFSIVLLKVPSNKDSKSIYSPPFLSPPDHRALPSFSRTQSLCHPSHSWPKNILDKLIKSSK